MGDVAAWEACGCSGCTLDVGLMSNQSEGRAFLSFSAQGLDERKDGGCSRAAPHRMT